MVDEQAQRAPRRGPAAGDQLVGVRRPPAGNLKGQVEVEVALSPGPARAQPPVAAGGARGRAGRRGRTAARRAAGPAARSCGSVAAPRSASSATAASASVRSRSWKAASSSRPTAGETCSSWPWRAGELVAAQRPAAALADDVARRGAAQRAARSPGSGPSAFPGGSAPARLGPASAARSARARSPRACARSPPRAAAGRRARRPRRRRTSRRPGCGSASPRRRAELAAEPDEVDRAAHRGAHPHLRRARG